MTTTRSGQRRKYAMRSGHFEKSKSGHNAFRPFSEILQMIRMRSEQTAFSQRVLTIYFATIAKSRSYANIYVA